jgi:hypothetical protein
VAIPTLKIRWRPPNFQGRRIMIERSREFQTLRGLLLR